MNISRIPDEVVVEHVLCHFGAFETLKLRQVNSWFDRICTCDYIWKKRYLTYFGSTEDSTPISQEDHNWLCVFREKSLKFKEILDKFYDGIAIFETTDLTPFADHNAEIFGLTKFFLPKRQRDNILNTVSREIEQLSSRFQPIVRFRTSRLHVDIRPEDLKRYRGLISYVFKNAPVRLSEIFQFSNLREFLKPSPPQKEKTLAHHLEMSLKDWKTFFHHEGGIGFSNLLFRSATNFNSTRKLVVLDHPIITAGEIRRLCMHTEKPKFAKMLFQRVTQIKQIKQWIEPKTGILTTSELRKICCDEFPELFASYMFRRHRSVVENELYPFFCDEVQVFSKRRERDETLLFSSWKRLEEKDVSDWVGTKDKKLSVEDRKDEERDEILLFSSWDRLKTQVRRWVTIVSTEECKTVLLTLLDDEFCRNQLHLMMFEEACSAGKLHGLLVVELGIFSEQEFRKELFRPARKKFGKELWTNGLYFFEVLMDFCVDQKMFSEKELKDICMIDERENFEKLFFDFFNFEQVSNALFFGSSILSVADLKNLFFVNEKSKRMFGEMLMSGTASFLQSIEILKRTRGALVSKEEMGELLFAGDLREGFAKMLFSSPHWLKRIRKSLCYVVHMCQFDHFCFVVEREKFCNLLFDTSENFKEIIEVFDRNELKKLCVEEGMEKYVKLLKPKSEGPVDSCIIS